MKSETIINLVKDEAERKSKLTATILQAVAGPRPEAEANRRLCYILRQRGLATHIHNRSGSLNERPIENSSKRQILEPLLRELR